MSPKEKAERLVKKYILISWKGKEFELQYYKQCALIAVDEILLTETLKPLYCGYTTPNQTHIDYWTEVKKEIEKIAF